MNLYQNSMYQTNPYLQNHPYYPQNNGINWVQGVEGAKAWQLTPNSNVLLMDSENDGRFYIKVSDNVGMCTLRSFEYKEITNTPATTSVMPDIDLSDYVKKSELQSLIASMLGGSHEQSLSTNDGKSIITK